MAFQLRLVDIGSYRQLAGELDRARGGDRAALEALLERCKASLASGEFERWNERYGWVAEQWRGTLDSGARGPEGVDLVGEIAVALLCFPDFQYSVHASEGRSPTFVPLGDHDGGLFGLLADADPWFDDLFSRRFPVEVERYGFGAAMIVLGPGDVRHLREATEKVRLPDPDSRAAGPLLRLRALADRALSEERFGIAISEFG